MGIPIPSNGCHEIVWRVSNTQLQEFGEKGASASDWAAVVSSSIGGKAGGKGATSIGNGTNPDKVDEAVTLATEYLSKFKL